MEERLEMNNIKVKFECDSSEYMELRNKSVWVAVHNKLVIMKNKRSRRKRRMDRKVNYRIVLFNRYLPCKFKQGRQR